MVACINIILLLSSAIGAFAAPAIKARGQTFSVPAVHNENSTRNGTAALLKVYAKYGLKPTSADNILSSVLEKRQDGSAPATPDPHNVEYLCPVSIGGQTLNLDFDTGSADL
jgi:aspergillopepsin I